MPVNLKDTNWESIKQAMVNDAAKFKNNILAWSAKDIEQRLISKGASKQNIEISADNTVVRYSVRTEDAMEAGQVYFDSVHEEISNNPNWPEGA